jgi:hypothetical protein
VQISQPFGKREVLGVLTEIKCACKSSYSELYNDPLERQYCHIRPEHEEDRQVTSDIREMHRENMNPGVVPSLSYHEVLDVLWV